MRPPLELHIYERDEDGRYVHPVHGYFISDIDIDIFTEQKRFTDTELAAEYWQSQADYALHGWTEAVTFIDMERKTWRRFATRPHISEE